MTQGKTRTWDRYAIRAAVNRKGKALRTLAIEAGLEPSACRVALIRSNVAGERVISEFLGVPLSELWPSRYPTSQHSSPAGSKPESAPSASPNGGGV